MTGPRGRPPEVVRRAPGEGMPIGSRTADLQPTSRAILEAAHQLLVDHGVKGVTMAAVARAAHVDVTTVAYHFRTRDGLIEALMDWLWADPVADLVDEAQNLDTVKQRWHAYLDTLKRNWTADAGDTGVAPITQAYFDIAAHSLRRDTLRHRIAALRSWNVDAYLQTFGDDDVPGAKVLGDFIFAAIDGIELHQAIGGQTFPLDDVMDLLERLILSVIEPTAGVSRSCCPGTPQSQG